MSARSALIKRSVANAKRLIEDLFVQITFNTLPLCLPERTFIQVNPVQVAVDSGNAQQTCASLATSETSQSGLSPPQGRVPQLDH